MTQLLLLAAVSLSACQTMPQRNSATVLESPGQRAWFDGVYDNHEQVAQSSSIPVPWVRFEIAPLQKAGWYLWKVRQKGDTELEAIWAMRSLKSLDGSVVMTPWRALVADPGLGKDFNEDQWVALDACTLRGAMTSSGLAVRTDLPTCATVAPGIGASVALLPISIDHVGEALRVRLYADQVRGADAYTDARLVRWFTGWAAINGAGPNAKSESSDWHMNRDLRIGNEGGKASVNWRDGQPSGYSLRLERATYRDGDVLVLKLSVIEDVSGRAIAYAWANPEATSIGINLGWIQVGLDGATTVPSR
ncbi:hypothetical protein [Dokdonella sp.]|uniref:hypothetical protein n=1 Tax=Dokdonella sp. TaxID=2291710 RepID=UPI003C374420